MTNRYRLLKILAWLVLASLAAGGAISSGVYLYLSPKLPSVESLREIRLQIPLRVYTADNVLIGEFGEKKRVPVAYSEVPRDFVHAILAAEDDKFLEHGGVDLGGLLRAATELIATGSIQSGGSTITMQVAKNYFLSRERTFTRKFTEILLALRIEQELSKQEILELYVNKIYLGNRAYGIGAAAQVYYGKTIDQLELAQLAMIAGLPKAPSSYNPLANPERALQRRDWILGRMHKLGHISQVSMELAQADPVSAKYHGAELELEAPWIAEMARAEMVERFGLEAYTNGYEVKTTVRADLQRAANRAVFDGLIAYTSRHGYRGPEGQLALPAAAAITPLEPSQDAESGLVENPDVDSPPPAAWLEALARIPDIGSLRAAAVLSLDEQVATAVLASGEVVTLDWEDNLEKARPYISENATGAAPKLAADILQVGDIIRLRQLPGRWLLAQVPAAQAALVSLNPTDGGILAMVGGFDFRQSKFNRVTQAKRQPGSNFKPFLYAAGLENGFTAASIINDAPVVFEDDKLENTWRPVNSSGRFYGPTRLRKALYLSRNLVSIRLLRAVGISRTTSYVERFGFERRDLPRDLSLALGTLTVTPMSIVDAYAVLANGGFKVSPYVIREVRNLQGETLFMANPALACPACETAAAEQAAADLQADQPEGLADTADNTQSDDITPIEAPTILASEDLAGSGSAEMASDAPPMPGGDEASTDIPPPEPVYAERVMDARVNYLVTSILQDVIRRGTGTRAKVLQRTDLAGKTGTTNGPTDAWFSGYSQDIVTTAWLGFDQNQLLGRREFGGTSALPIWIDYMRTALAESPEKNRVQPDGMTMVRIDPQTGLLADPAQADAIFEIFRLEKVPTEYAEPPANALDTELMDGDTLEEEDLF